MASLPSNTFLCNYNARDYVPSAHTIPKTEGQLFNQDLVLNANPASYTESSVTLNGQYMYYKFSNVASNIFRRTGTEPLTIIAKIKKGIDTSGEHCIFSCRNRSALNYLLFNPANGCSNDTVFLHNNDRYYNTCPYVQFSTEPNIFSIQVANGTGFGQSYTDNQTFRSIANTYGSNNTDAIGFFQDSYNTSAFETWRGEFYWIYISTEALTSSEISQVIKYNEGSSFSIDKDSASFSYDSGFTTVDVSSDNPWTASTNESWIALSQYTGSTDANITVSVSNNYENPQRTGTVSFTDGEEILTLTITQNADTRIILKNVYRSGNSVKQMFRSGVKIYQQLMRLIFNVDTDSITFDNTGGTYTINIIANENWTMTIPNWVTASALSGTGNAAIIISTNSVPENKLEGSIIINCGNKSHTISVVQNAAVNYVSCIYKPVAVANTSSYMIDTLLNATTDTIMRINYIGRGVQQGNTFIGYDQTMPNCPNDNSDFRFFSYSTSNVTLDINSSRQQTTQYGTYRENGVEYDITVHNNYLVDNKTNTIFNSGTTQTTIAAPLATIHIDLSAIKVKEAQIWQGGVLVFDGKAALSPQEQCSLYDSVTGTYFTNTNFEITYDA